MFQWLPLIRQNSTFTPSMMEWRWKRCIESFWWFFIIAIFSFLSSYYHELDMWMRNVEQWSIPDICHFFTLTHFKSWKFYTRVNYDKIAKKHYFSGSSGFFYTQPKFLHAQHSRRSWQISGMSPSRSRQLLSACKVNILTCAQEKANPKTKHQIDGSLEKV